MTPLLLDIDITYYLHYHHRRHHSRVGVGIGGV